MDLASTNVEETSASETPITRGDMMNMFNSVMEELRDVKASNIRKRGYDEKSDYTFKYTERETI